MEYGPAEGATQVRMMGIALASFLVIACTCGRKADDGQTSTDAATTPAPVESATGAATKGTPATAEANTPSPGPGSAGPTAGGKTVAENSYGKVQVNDAGATTMKRGSDSVTTGPGGVTKANGVVMDPKKGTVSVPGMGNFKTP